jgi:hypothetical protein
VGRLFLPCANPREIKKKKKRKKTEEKKKDETLRFLVFNKTNAEEGMFNKNHSKVIYYQ